MIERSGRRGAQAAFMGSETTPDILPPIPTYAGLAQLVVHLICNQGVTGSNPVAGTDFIYLINRL